MPRALVVGTRGSALALAQTALVCEALRRIAPGVELRVERIVTTGDARASEPLGVLGRGVFVTEIEEALRQRRIDLAVHSAKDLPSSLPTDVAIAAFLRRADARDVLVSRAGPLRALPPGARVGTSSPRRMCQVRALRPDLDVREVRGNVDTRLRKLAAGEFDALLLAAAGLVRLGRSDAVTEWFGVTEILPCVGQGAIAVQTRAGDTEVISLVAPLDDAVTRRAVLAERAFLAELGAGCLAPAAAHARDGDDEELEIIALIGATDGRHVSARHRGSRNDPVALGRAVARDLLRNGGDALLGAAYGPLRGVRVALTRTTEQSAELVSLLRAKHAQVLVCPTIAIAPVRDTTELDTALQRSRSAEWIAFTSANAVRAIAVRLSELRRDLPGRPRLAAVGGVTAAALARSLRPADFVAAGGNARLLGETLPDVDGRRVLVPCGDLADDTLTTVLRDRGADVHRVIAYHTVPGEGVDVLARAVAERAVDVIVFASPSSVDFAAAAMVRAFPHAGARVHVVCIGETTAAAARATGMSVDAVASSQSAEGIVEAIEGLCATRAGKAPAV